MKPTPSDDADWRFPNPATPLGSPRYYAIRFAPAAAHDRYALLFAWYDTIREIGRQPRDSGAARLKLDWWHEELARLGRGEPRHPLARAMAAGDIGRDSQLDALQVIVSATEQEVLAPPPDDEAFATACRHTGGMLFTLLDPKPPGGPAALLNIESGAYCEAVERVRRLAAAPRCLPPELAGDAPAHPSTTTRRERFDRLLSPFAIGTAGRRSTETAAINVKLTALAAAMHDKMRRQHYPVDRLLVDRPPIAHLWTAWRNR